MLRQETVCVSSLHGTGALVEEELTRSVIGAFFEVYNEVGFGFLEHVHILALERELAAHGHLVSLEVPVQIMYKGHFLCAQRLDMIVDNTLIVETKFSEVLPPTAMRQLQNYLRCTNLELGLLLHFGPKPRFFRRFLPNSQKVKNKKELLTTM